LLVTFDLNATEAFFGEVFGVVHVDHVFVFILFTIHATNHEFLPVGCSLLLKADQLALCQVVDVDVAVRLPVYHLLGVFGCAGVVLVVQVCKFIDLVLHQSVLAWRLHQQLGVVV